MEAWEHILVHSGQHYDAIMSDVFFEELGMPEPKYHLGVGSGSHGQMTAAALVGFEKVLLEEKPDGVIVYGDTNTTLAGALAAAKLHIPIVHIEAGIRMFPKTMPEEINRVLTDRISAVMCCCSDLGVANLEKEGIVQGVHNTGDIMYDCYLHMEKKFDLSLAQKEYGLADNSYYVATMHRDYNVDDPASLKNIVIGLSEAADANGKKVLFFVHPRTKARLAELGNLAISDSLMVHGSVGYLELMSLVKASAGVITDSGGLQKEAYFAGKRAVVVMPDTGWQELVDCGWNILASPQVEEIVRKTATILNSVPVQSAIYGNGKAAEQIVSAITGSLI